MYRIAGFITGSSLAVLLILLVLGVPRLPDPEPATPQPRDDAPPAREPAVATATPEPAPPASVPPPAMPAAEPEPVPVQTAQTEEQPAGDSETRLWHAFWTPFRSRIAANGFVGRLESLTGFDYRVVKIENGVFEVAFAYSSDTERDEKLSTIASVTGLELPDS